MTNAELITLFYDSFARGNAEAMVKCYDDAIEFEDPAFGTLKGAEAKNMWRMLMTRSKGNIKIAFSDVKAGDTNGTANWVAEYVFSGTGRKVVNKVSAEFEFRNGKIIRHTDRFDFNKWAQQALGWRGYLLGRTSFLKNTIQQRGKTLLEEFTRSRKNK
ncbi:MAG: nuclear transport factor 2 family protein [Bacteroidia bacterium]